MRPFACATVECIISPWYVVSDTKLIAIAVHLCNLAFVI